jgi:hypothetical protein
MMCWFNVKPEDFYVEVSVAGCLGYDVLAL